MEIRPWGFSFSNVPLLYINYIYYLRSMKLKQKTIMKRNHTNWSCNFQLPVRKFKGNYYVYHHFWSDFHWVKEAMVEFDNGTFIDWDEIKRPDNVSDKEEKALHKKLFRH